MIKYNSIQIVYFGWPLDIDYTLSIDSGDGVNAPESTLTIDKIFLNGRDVSDKIKDVDIMDLVNDVIAEL